MPTPTQAEAVLAAMEALPPDPGTSAGQTSADYPDFAALRYEVYVAPLVERAMRGAKAT